MYCVFTWSSRLEVFLLDFIWNWHVNKKRFPPPPESNHGPLSLQSLATHAKPRLWRCPGSNFVPIKAYIGWWHIQDFLCIPHLPQYCILWGSVMIRLINKGFVYRHDFVLKWPHFWHQQMLAGVQMYIV